MFTKQHLGSLFLVSGVILATWVTVEVASAAEPFTLTSPAFKDGTRCRKRTPTTHRAMRTASARTFHRLCLGPIRRPEPRASRLPWSIRKGEAERV